MLDIDWNKIKTPLKIYLPAVLLVAFELFILILIVLLSTQIFRNFSEESQYKCVIEGTASDT